MTDPLNDMSPDEILTAIVKLEERQQAHYDLSAQKWENFEENTKTFYGKVLDHEEQLIELNKWQSHISGIWKATLFIATVTGFAIGIIVQIIR